jgi:argininosuccinate synthase
MAGKMKVVLAYSGGLDTSIILKWLQSEYDAEVVTFTADLGQGDEVEPARAKAEMLGVKPGNIFIEDLRESSSATSSSQCSARTLFTRDNICWARRSPGR